MTEQSLTAFGITATHATDSLIEQLHTRAPFAAAWDAAPTPIQDAIRYELGLIVRWAMREAQSLEPGDDGRGA